MEIALYLLPVTLGDTPIGKQCCLLINKGDNTGNPSFRRGGCALGTSVSEEGGQREIDIDALTFYTLNKHTSPEDISGYLKPLVEGQPMGVISEAGCPAVADPGSGRSGYCTTEKLKSGPLGGTLFHYPLCHGFRLQRTELCLPRLSSHRTGRACQKS